MARSSAAPVSVLGASVSAVVVVSAGVVVVSSTVVGVSGGAVVSMVSVAGVHAAPTRASPARRPMSVRLIAASFR
ncbi:MAG: hypothetical protein ACRD02_09760 [Acidimicrobiia bacterium]